MSYDDRPNLEQERALVKQILARAVSDPDYAVALRQDPRAALGEAGVVEPMMDDLTRELRLAGPSGWSSDPPETQCAFTCDSVSCIITWCGCVPWTT